MMNVWSIMTENDLCDALADRWRTSAVAATFALNQGGLVREQTANADLGRRPPH